MFITGTRNYTRRHTNTNGTREQILIYRLTLFRDHIMEELKIPFITSETILPDSVLEDIVNNVKHIVTLQQLHRTMEKHHFHVRAKSTFRGGREAHDGND
jgi:hypothetical protein